MLTKEWFVGLLYAIIDYIQGNKVIQKAKETVSVQPVETPLWMTFAEAELGQAEIVGSKHNKRIIEYFATTTYKATDDETPWCSAFVNWCATKAHEKQGNVYRTNKANARSWLNVPVKLDKPKYGCVVIFKRGNSSWQGHVGFYAGEKNGMIKVLGGNQSNKVCYKYYSKKDLLGFRWLV